MPHASRAVPARQLPALSQQPRGHELGVHVDTGTRASVAASFTSIGYESRVERPQAENNATHKEVKAREKASLVMRRPEVTIAGAGANGEVPVRSWRKQIGNGQSRQLACEPIRRQHAY